MRPEAIVYNSQYLIHALNIANTRVQLPVYKQNACEYVSMSLYVVEADLSMQMRLLHLRLFS